MTWEELQDNIRDLGFDDENPETMITSANRAINFIKKIVVEANVEYFRMRYEDPDWEPVNPTPITEETEDEFIIQIPDKLIDLVPLLAAHYAWLDDDIQKATMYWNEYDDLKNQLVADMQRPQKCTFFGGLRW